MSYEARLGHLFHDLRHFFASLLIAFGEPIPYASQQLRHDSPATTLKIYAHLIREGRRLDRDTDTGVAGRDGPCDPGAT